MGFTRKHSDCGSCMIRVFRDNQLYWHCSFCRVYLKALAGGELKLVPIEEIFPNQKEREKEQEKDNVVR